MEKEELHFATYFSAKQTIENGKEVLRLAFCDVLRRNKHAISLIFKLSVFHKQRARMAGTISQSFMLCQAISNINFCTRLTTRALTSASNFAAMATALAMQEVGSWKKEM